MAPMKFYLERQTAAHHGDRIYFQTHPERSLSVDDAVELTAQLVFLLGPDNDQALATRIRELRGDVPQPAPKAMPRPAPRRFVNEALAASGKESQPEKGKESGSSE